MFKKEGKNIYKLNLMINFLLFVYYASFHKAIQMVSHS